VHPSIVPLPIEKTTLRDFVDVHNNNYRCFRARSAATFPTIFGLAFAGSDLGDYDNTVYTVYKKPYLPGLECL
ncbi:hypothetical protein, partial [Paraburkholderia sp. SIMBA_053]|uniref:hypothetical protein n=1 Tax=Paraburkholderia sp. SIMBA_053 TaxID=3085794 RepID=UPI00397DADE6